MEGQCSPCPAEAILGKTPCPLSISLLILIGTLFGCVSVDRLTDAASRGDSQAVRVLLDQGHAGDINEALIDSACNGHAEVVQLLSDRGANVNYFRRRHTYYDEGLGGQFNSLECAAFYGRPEIVSLLLNSGANRDYKTTHDTTALDLARRQERTTDYAQSGIPTTPDLLTF